MAVGLIGGVHRYCLGGFTALPCALATVLVGLFGGLIYRLRASTFIGVAGAVAFAALMEAFHKALVLLLARPYSEAVLVVREVVIPMISANALGIMNDLRLYDLQQDKGIESDRRVWEERAI